jgi:hypothetical protein
MGRVNPSDLRLPNGMPCIDVDEADRRIGVIVPEGWKLVAMTPHSGQELTTEPRILPGKPYACGHVLAAIPRDPPPHLSG